MDLKTEIHHFVDHQVELSSCGHYILFFDSQIIKRVMHHVACDMLTGGCTSIREASVQHALIHKTKQILKQKHLKALKSRVARLIDPDVRLYFENSLNFFENLAVTEQRCNQSRAEFLNRAALRPPEVLRLIDIEATCREKHVSLMDHWGDADVEQEGYSAISHTYGMDVYKVFDCPCATKWSAQICHPRCSAEPCVHVTGMHESNARHQGVLNDILRMCTILREAGVKYAWHDGVCIAQHNEIEVQETIKCIGWIYANARETIVFLHYVGWPMAPIRISGRYDELASRWQTRVWTLQEAALSKHRRYCVQISTGPFGDCQSFQEFCEKLSFWYRGQWSKVEIIGEEALFEIILEINTILMDALPSAFSKADALQDDDPEWKMAVLRAWQTSMNQLIETLQNVCFTFPSVNTAIQMCSRRECKHEGDRVNSIMALAHVKDFVAPKDVDVEASTLEFFKRQGQRGLACAIFSVNSKLPRDAMKGEVRQRQHTWLPDLGSMLESCYVPGYDNICMPEFRVVEDGMLEVRGELVCVRVRFTAVFTGMRVYLSAIRRSTDANVPLLGFGNHELAMVIDSCYQGSLHFRTILPEVHDCDMGVTTIFKFESSSGEGLVMKYGDEIEDQEIIDVHLVLPYKIASYVIRLNVAAEVCSTLPVLVVQGSLDASVSKIGQLTPNISFLKPLFEILNHHDIKRDFSAIKIRQRLVVR